MIIWSEKQYQNFLAKSGLKEPTSQPVETPKPVAMPAMPQQPTQVVQHVGTNWTKPVFLVCLTVIAVVGMVHENPGKAEPNLPKIEKVQPVHHAKKKIHHSHKKSLTHAKKVYNTNDVPDVVELESRITTLEERMNDAGF